MAVDQEMEAVFKSVRSGDEVPDNTIGVDPESGNPVPAGSLPEEVRDDIPAQLSEGEYVIPADVLRYYGVKFFEDLRAEAKYAYQQMNEDGRIGGEPLGMEMVEPEDDLDIIFDISDLEVIETPDEPEEAFLGKLFGKKDDDGDSGSKSSKDSERAKKQIEELEALIKQRKARKDAAKDMRSRDPSEGPSIAEQINFGGNYSDKDKPKKKKAEKLERKTYRASPSEVREQRRKEQGVNLLENKPDVWGNLGKAFGFAEGGDTSTYDNIGGFGDTAEGFDTTAYGEGVGQVEMRAYQNDMGRKIMITFIDGVPQMEIPEGYYPVGTEAVAIEPEDTATKSQGNGGGGGGGSPAPAPEPINYQALTIAEMEDMLKEQQGMTGKLITAGAGIVNPILGMAVKFGLSQNAKQLEAEMERRIKSGTLTDSERAKMEDMLAQAQEDQPGLLQRLYGKITGKDGEDYEGVEKGAVDAAVKEALGYQPVDETQSDIKGSTQVPITTEILDPANNEPDNTKAGAVEGGYKARTAQQTQAGYNSYGSEKGNTAGQGDSSTPMTDAFGSGNTFTNQPSQATRSSTSRREGSGGSWADTNSAQRAQMADAASQASSRTEDVVRAAERNLATQEEVQQIRSEGARVESALRDRSRGVQRGFSKGGLGSKKKKK